MATIEFKPGTSCLLRSAIRYFHREHGPLASVPTVVLPEKPPKREGYHLSRKELAQRLLAAWRRPETRHVARLILLGAYSGSRLQAMLNMRWVPSVTSAWIDLDADDPVIH